MKLAPRIIQAMEILQLPMMALQERIASELESNPVLELHTPGVDEEAPPARVEESPERGEQEMVVDESGGNSDDFERLANFEEEFAAELARSDTPARPKPALPGELDARAADRELSDALAHAAVLDGGPAIKLDALGQPDELLDAAAAAG